MIVNPTLHSLNSECLQTNSHSGTLHSLFIIHIFTNYYYFSSNHMLYSAVIMRLRVVFQNGCCFWNIHYTRNNCILYWIYPIYVIFSMKDPYYLYFYYLLNKSIYHLLVKNKYEINQLL